MLSHGFTADYCSTEHLLRWEMIGGSAGGFTALVVYIFTHTYMFFFFVFFLKGQATAAICILYKKK